MRVALDATPLTVPKGGIARYTTELARALARCYPQDEILLLSDQPKPPPTWLSRRWWFWGLPQELKRLAVQVFHGTDYAVPYRRVCPSVLTLHDLSPWLDLSWHHDATRVRRRTPWMLRTHRASMVITMTQAVRRQVLGRFGLPEDRVVVVPLAAAALFQPAPPLQRPNPYFVTVSTLEPRKNLPRLFDAWRELRRSRNVDLLIVGRRRDDFPGLPQAEGLEWLGALEDSALPPLLSGAVAFVYPSLYEGFGLPLLEAMQCGAPVIASTDPALAEVSGGAALHCDPRDTRPWIAAFESMLDNPSLREELRQRSRARAREFSWDRTAHLTHAVYEEAIRRFHG